MIDLLLNPIIASALLSIAIGIIGTLMLINRSHYIAASIAHGSYGGIGLSIYLGTSMLFTTTLFALALALVLSYITIKHPHRNDTVIGVIWAVGMSLGIILTDLTPGYHASLMSFLFGDILMIPKEDLLYMGAVDIGLLLMITLLYHRFLAIFYDREFASLLGLRVKTLHTILLLMTALTIVMSIRSVGLILVIALFSIPPFIAEKFTKKIYQTMILSAVLAFVFSLSGLFISYSFDISATASIILISAFIFFLAVFKK
jgi:zinc transport system permease protein